MLNLSNYVIVIVTLGELYPSSPKERERERDQQSCSADKDVHTIS